MYPIHARPLPAAYQAARRVLGRSRHLACIAMLSGMSISAGATTATQVFDTVVTARYVQQEQCDLSPQFRSELQKRLGRGDGTQAQLSRTQVRDLALQIDQIASSHCRTVAPMLRKDEALARDYERAKSARIGREWDRFLADGSATKWAAISADFRTELVALRNLVNLETTLRDDVFNPDSRKRIDPSSPTFKQLMNDIRKVSLTKSEADTRFFIAIAANDRAFREILPARFDLERLIQIEAKTRQIGLQLIDLYKVDFERLYDDKTRNALSAQGKSTPQQKKAVRDAEAQIAALAQQYKRQ